LRFGTVWTFLLFRTQRSLIKGEEFFVDRFVWRTRSGQQKDMVGLPVVSSVNSIFFFLVC